MPGFEFHPFLESHEIPNKKTSPKEDSLKVFQPFDKRNQAAPFNASGIAEYEILSSDEEEAEIKKEPQEIPTARPFDTNGKISLADHIGLKENERLHKEAESKDKTEKIKRLFKSSDTKKITVFLSGEDSESLEFANEIEITNQIYKSDLVDLNFLDNNDWKILTALRLFHQETLEHSIGTYLVAKEKIEKLGELGKEIIHEGVSLDQFYRACLFHDIGKMAVPDFILNSKTNDRKWAMGLAVLEEKEKDEIFVRIFDEKGIVIPDNVRDNPEAMADFLEINRIRAVNYVPIKTDLTQDEIIKLNYQGLSEEDSLLEIMAIHERKSEDILKDLGFVIEAFLAGNHHNHHNADKKLGEKPISLSAMHLSIRFASTILHLADMKQALESKRSYHSAHDLLRILAFSVDEAKNNSIDSKLTSIWILDETLKIPSEDLEKVRNMSSPGLDENKLKKQKEDLKAIEEFLGAHL